MQLKNISLFFRGSRDGNRLDNVFVAALLDRKPHLGLARRRQQQLDGQHLRPEQPADGGSENTALGRRRAAHEFARNREN